MKHILFIYLSYFLSYSIYAQDKTIDQNILDDDITLEKKSLIILTAAYDEDQEVAKKYSAVCTPDFFGYNKNSELQYRGRILDAKKLKPIDKGETELKKAMKLIAETGKGPQEQIPSMGCSIKWFK